MATAIEPLVPQCSLDNTLVTLEDFNPSKAGSFEPISWSYYKDVIPTCIPGLVLGALALIGFFFFIIWILVQYCTCNCCSGRGSKKGAAKDQQFVKEEGTYGSKKFGMDKKSRADHKPSYTWLVQTIIVAMTLATVGVSGWGIAASLESTDHQITNFWALVDQVDKKVANTTQNLNTLDQQLGTLQASTGQLAANAQAIANAIPALGLSNTGISTALTSLAGAGPAIESVRQGIQTGINTVEQYMGSTIASMENSFQDPTLFFEDKGRYIAIIVMFSLTIVASLGAGFLSLRVGHPIWASVFVALLWLCVGLLMIMGVAFLQGLSTVSKDACLYIENFSVNYVQSNVADGQKKQWILNAMTYYFNQAEVVEEAPGAALAAVTGVDVTPVYNIVMGPEVSQLTRAVSAADPNMLASAGVPTASIQAVQNIAALLQPVTTTLTKLDYEASRAGVAPLYRSVKSLICCDVASASNDLFTAWTVVGSLGLVLSVLCSIRIVRHTFKEKKGAK